MRFDAPDLDAGQQAAREAVLAGGHHLIVGAAGSGKTTLATAAFLRWCRLRSPGRALLLVPTRRRAGHLREVIASRLARTTGQVLVRTPASLAFSLLRLHALERGEPAPTLITGPEQDQVLEELIEGHLAGDGARVDWPPGLSPDTLRLRAFRDELRDVLMRAAEAGLDGAGLAQWGVRHRRPAWIAAGQLLQEYLQVTALGELTPDRGARYDAATIVDQAVQLLDSGADVPGFDLVLHDDYQDATLASARLLGRLAGGGARLALLADPDSGVQSFRGGSAGLTQTATLPLESQEGAFGARVHVLEQVYRHDGPLRAAVSHLASGLPALAGARRRAATSAEPDGDEASHTFVSAPSAPQPPARESPASSAPELTLLPTGPQEAAHIARRLREAHLRDGTPWSQMAVIVRGSAQVGVIRRGLRTAGVPLAVTRTERPLRDEPAVIPLLVALDVLVAGGQPTAEQAVALLTSPIGGLDAVSLRTLRRQLRQHARLAGAESEAESVRDVSSAQLLADVLADAGLRARLPVAVRRAPDHVAAVLAAGTRAQEAGDGVESVLWEMWDRTGLARAWQQRALAGGAGADRADADLDAVVTLFSAAERFADRTTGADPAAFARHLAAQDFAADTLAAQADHEDAVAVHTPASAAGEQWQLVAVAGVQEEVWPDLRIRDTLLGAQELAELATGRHVPVPGEAASAPDAGDHQRERHRLARQSVLEDELRTFVAACSRARQRLIVTAVLAVDQRPSPFFEMLLPPGAELPAVTHVAPPLDLRGLVGALRAQLQPVLSPAVGGRGAAVPDAAATRARAAAGLLAELAQAGVPGADPACWPELAAPTSTEAIHPPTAPVPVSPSAVEKAMTCPLHWALTSNGGRAGATAAQNLGNLVHEIAAQHPQGSEAELLAALDERWGELDLPDTYLGRRERERGEAMVRQLAAYIASHPAQARTEDAFDVVIGAARLRGRVDRVEQREAGLHIVDLKTGRSAVSAADAAIHPQLGSYQAAVAAGAFGEHDVEPAGASLGYVAANRNVTVRDQAPLAQSEDPAWAGQMLQEAAHIMSGGAFEARHSAICGYCPVKTSCPAQPQGRRVSRPEAGA